MIPAVTNKEHDFYRLHHVVNIYEKDINNRKYNKQTFY